MKKPTIKEILANNPHIDGKKLSAGRRLLKEIRTLRGKIGTRNDRETPYGQRRVLVGRSDQEKDPRTVILRSR